MASTVEVPSKIAHDLAGLWRLTDTVRCMALQIAPLAEE